jgi:peroxiredoxin
MPVCLSQREAGSARALILASVLAIAAMLMLAAIFGRTPAAPQVAFVSLAGERITSAGLRGRVVLVKFWATDCVTCVKEMPDMVRTYNRYRNRGFELIAVAMSHNPPNYVIKYAEENRLPFQVALDPMGEIAKAFGNVILTPTTFVIDRRGAIVLKISGEVDVARLSALLEEKLKEPI